MFRLVIFTGQPLSQCVLLTLEAIKLRFPDTQFLVLAHAPKIEIWRLARSQLRNLRFHGWRWLPYQANRAGKLALSKFRRRRSPGVRLAVTRKLEELEASLRIVPAASFADPATIAIVRDFEPDLGLSIGGPILKPEMFSIPRSGTINLHQGKLPEYRGMPPAFWELWDDQKEVGVSVHVVERGLDSGNVIATDRVEVEPFATPAGVRVKLDAISPRLVADAIAQIREHGVQGRPQNGVARTNRRPSLAQERQLAVRRAAEPQDMRSRVSRSVKTNVLRAYNLGTGVGPGRRDCVSVLLYHRVSDRYRDMVSCGVEKFDLHMRYIADHHRVVTLQELLNGPMPRGEGAIVAVTFDDGYLDNFEYAAPILAKHDVPATFFVSTQIVDEQLMFDHDRIALGHRVPTMNWDQMRQMLSEGFMFGSHTATHANLAKVDDEVAEHELAISKQMLRDKLGLADAMFAYPYGSRGDFTPRRLEQVKSAGYSCNCSAYGGVNPLEVDRWNVLRFGVDDRFSLTGLRSRIHGWH